MKLLKQVKRRRRQLLAWTDRKLGRLAADREVERVERLARRIKRQGK